MRWLRLFRRIRFRGWQRGPGKGGSPGLVAVTTAQKCSRATSSSQVSRLKPRPQPPPRTAGCESSLRRFHRPRVHLDYNIARTPQRALAKSLASFMPSSAIITDPAATMTRLPVTGCYTDQQRDPQSQITSVSGACSLCGGLIMRRLSRCAVGSARRSASKESRVSQETERALAAFDGQRAHVQPSCASEAGTFGRWREKPCQARAWIGRASDEQAPRRRLW
jgi:hypothetical protein